MDTPAISDLVRSPIFWQSFFDAAERAKVQAYFERLREDYMALAQAEAERLRDTGYFKHMLRQMRDDQEVDNGRGRYLGWDRWSAQGLGLASRTVHENRLRQRRRRIKPRRMTRRHLRLLFEAVAARSTNVILSQVMLGPVSLLDKKMDWYPASIFADPKRHNGAAYTLGFVQIEKNGLGSSSVSVPFFGFDDRMLGEAAPYDPLPLLQAFQKVMTAGNHDMQHHLTNTTLNPSIANTLTDDPLAPRDGIKKWSTTHFDVWSDADMKSYESWLILNHARVQKRLMAENDDVTQAVGDFMGELKRIGEAVGHASGDTAAHQVVDYFGTMLGFVMMRFLPFNHPLFKSVLDGLEEIDPLSKTPPTNPASSDAFMRIQLHYADAGTPLNVSDYACAKLGHIAYMAPEIARLNVPNLRAGNMDEVHDRVGRVYIDMMEAAAHTAWFLPDGVHDIPLKKTDGRMELHCRDGQPFREGDLPAVITRDNVVKKETRQWYVDGLPGRAGGLPPRVTSFENTTAFRDYAHIEQYRDVGLPINHEQANNVEVRPDGSRSHVWYHQGDFSRRVTVDAENKLIEDSHPSRGDYVLTQPLTHPPLKLGKSAVQRGEYYDFKPEDFRKVSMEDLAASLKKLELPAFK